MKQQIVFDTTVSDDDRDNIGAYLRSSDGTLLTHTTDGSKEALDVFTELGKAEDSAHSSGDIGAMALAVRNDTEGSLVSADGDYAPLQVDSSGRLRVISDLDVTNLSEKAEDAAHSSGDIGDYVLAVRADTRPTDANTSADGDYASFFVNDSGELYVKDTDAAALLTTIDADTSNIASDTAALVVDLAAIETELLDQGTTLDGIKTDTAAMVVDLAAIETELLDQGTTLDSILTDTSAMVVDLAAIEVEQLAQGVTLDSIETDTGSIDTTLSGLSHAEDAAHVSGDAGIQALAVRNDTLAALAGTDGDYAPLQVDADGALYVTATNSEDVALANTDFANAQNSVTTTSESVVASALASRKYLFIANEGNRKLYIGKTTATAAAGFPIAPGSVLELRAGASIDIKGITSAGTADVRTLELS